VVIMEIPDEIRAYVLSEVGGTYSDHRVGVSELGSCIRKAWYKRRFPKMPDFESALRMFIGRLFHLYIEKDYENTEVSVTYDTGKGIIAGKIDAIVGDTAIDFKSKRDLKKISQYGPLTRDVNQVKFYAYMADLKRAKLLYYKISPPVKYEGSVDEFILSLKRGIVMEVLNSTHISFDVKMHDLTDVVRNYVTRAKILFEALEDERPPSFEDFEGFEIERPPEWECRFCEFRQICEYADRKR